MKVSKATRSRAIVALIAAALGSAASAQQAQTTAPIVDWPRPKDFPNENRAAALDHFRKARAFAQGDLFADFTLRCVTNAKYNQRVRKEQYDGIVEPIRVFDRLYRIGQMSVSAWALDTRDGIVLFDALDTEAEAREIMVPALRAVGLDPARIKWVIVTHSHFDHFGGAPYFQKTFGAKVISSDADWRVMETVTARAPAPKRDITVADGQTMRFGEVPVTFYVTPGHTVGTLSTIFPVTDAGRVHLVGFYGGLGLPQTVEAKRTQIASLVRWRGITAKAGVDTQIANHLLNDEGLERDEQLRYRRPGDPHPYVLGRVGYRNFLGVQEECVRFSLARDGFAE